MADRNYYSSSTKQKQNQNQDDINKIYTHFFYKALIVSTFLIILTIFPSQAPDFINQTLNTRGWEFLHILFVGIAVSYGLFSRKNDQPEKENVNNYSKFDNAQSYVSKLLHVSSFFDDEVNNPHRSSDGEQVQTWSSRYYRNEPPVVVAEDNSGLNHEQSVSVGACVNKTSSRINEKPLLLPVRSLKSRVLDTNEGSEESKSLYANSLTRSASSNWGSKRFSRRRGEDLDGLERQELVKEKFKETVVLPSPIPWRSRSERFERKDKREEADRHHSPPASYTLPPSYEQNRSFKAQVQQQQSSLPNSAATSPKQPSSPKIGEDFVRKKSIYRSPPPPPPLPPPTPPPFRRIQRSMPTKPTFRIEEDRFFESNRAHPAKSVRTSRNNMKELDNAERLSSGGVNMPTFGEFGGEEREEFVEKLVLGSDEDPESDEDYDEEGDQISLLKNEEAVVSISSSSTPTPPGGDGGPPDVDKKADEFIAKFREQIRLQRIESIKRSSSQISANKKQQSR